MASAEALYTTESGARFSLFDIGPWQRYPSKSLVSIAIPHHVGYLYMGNGMQSADGLCRAFDADSTGTPMGGGVGVVVLRRLEDALADGDQVYVPRTGETAAGGGATGGGADGGGGLVNLNTASTDAASRSPPAT